MRLSRIAAAAVFACLIGAPLFLSHRIRPEHRGGLTIRRDSLDVGRVCAQENYVQNLVFRNTDYRPIEVFKLAGSCSCMRLSHDRFVIQPGQQIDVVATLDLTARNADKERLSSWDLDLPLRATTSRGEYRWSIAGTVQNPYSFDGAELWFETPAEASSVSQAQFPFSCASGITPQKAKGGPLLEDVNLVQRSDSGYEVTCSSKPGLAVGSHESWIEVSGVTVTGDLVVGRRKVSFRIVPEVVAVPQTLFLGFAPLGTECQGGMQFRSSAGKSLRLLSVESNSDKFAVTAQTSNAKDIPLVDCRARADEIGPMTTLITAVLAADDGRTFKSIVPVTLIGK